MEIGESFSTALGSNSELSPSCRESCNFTFTEREQPPRDVFPQDFARLSEPDFFRVNSLLVKQDTVFRDVGGDLLRFRQRSDPLIIVGLLRGWVLFFFQERDSSGRSPIAHCRDLETDASSAPRQRRR